MRTFHTGGVATADDITQGLPRVEEIFEARKPRVLRLSWNSPVRWKSRRTAKRPKQLFPARTAKSRSISFRSAQSAKVETGDFVEAGDTLTEGSINPHDILKIQGRQGRSRLICSAKFRLFTAARALKFPISTSKLSFARCSARFRSKIPGDTDLLPGELIDIFKFEQTNDSVVAVGGVPATAKRKLLGITKASLATDSFLSAASFQGDDRVPTEAAIKGKG